MVIRLIEQRQPALGPCPGERPLVAHPVGYAFCLGIAATLLPERHQRPGWINRIAAISSRRSGTLGEIAEVGLCSQENREQAWLGNSFQLGERELPTIDLDCEEQAGENFLEGLYSALLREKTARYFAFREEKLSDTDLYKRDLWIVGRLRVKCLEWQLQRQRERSCVRQCFSIVAWIRKSQWRNWQGWCLRM
jgi:hypothetical protein